VTQIRDPRYEVIINRCFGERCPRAVKICEATKSMRTRVREVNIPKRAAPRIMPCLVFKLSGTWEWKSSRIRGMPNNDFTADRQFDFHTTNNSPHVNDAHTDHADCVSIIIPNRPPRHRARNRAPVPVPVPAPAPAVPISDVLFTKCPRHLPRSVAGRERVRAPAGCRPWLGSLTVVQMECGTCGGSSFSYLDARGATGARTHPRPPRSVCSHLPVRHRSHGTRHARQIMVWE
jgi:hypothetical protein